MLTAYKRLTQSTRIFIINISESVSGWMNLSLRTSILVGHDECTGVGSVAQTLLVRPRITFVALRSSQFSYLIYINISFPRLFSK